MKTCHRTEELNISFPFRVPAQTFVTLVQVLGELLSVFFPPGTVHQGGLINVVLDLVALTQTTRRNITRVSTQGSALVGLTLRR